LVLECEPPVEICNGEDDDCDGTIDWLLLWYLDADGDGHGDRWEPPLIRRCPPPVEGHTSVGDDCDDTHPLVFPGAPEECDGRDNDCDGVVPDVESDGDGDGLATCAGDCDDWNPLVHPGARELCNGVDDNCNGVRDEGC